MKSGGEQDLREQILNEKIELVSEIRDKFESSKSAVVVEYRGLSVSAITDLRRQLHQEGVDFKVYKNTMTRRAVEGAGYDGLLEILVGPNAIAFSDDAIAPSRILSRFAKKNKKLVIKKGVVEGEIVDFDKIKELSELPNKEGMIAMLLGALQSPIRDFAWAVKQISELEDREVGSAEEVVADEAVVEEPVVEEAAVEEPVVEEAVTEEVAAEEVVEETVTEEVTEEAVVEEETTEVVEEVKEEVEESKEEE